MDRNVDRSSSKMQYLCKLARNIFVVVLVFYLVAFGLFIGASMNYETPASSVAYAVAHSMLIVAVLATLVFGLNSVARGDTPFAKNQERRLCAIGILLILDAVIEFLFSAQAAFNLDAMQGMLLSVDVSNMGGVANLNIGTLILAVSSFCFAAAVRYGILLQQSADETI